MGVMVGFAFLFPNTELLLFFAIPVKAKWAILGYVAIDLFGGINPSQGDNVAHFAHLGGMIFGLALILWWRFRGYDGFESMSYGDSRLKQWIKQRWDQIRSKRPPRIKRDDDSKDYHDYHYHKPL
jgi:hypothetical protein